MNVTFNNQIETKDLRSVVIGTFRKAPLRLTCEISKTISIYYFWSNVEINQISSELNSTSDWFYC